MLQRSITFVSTANAGLDPIDYDRRLTGIGKAQAKARRIQLDRQNFDFVMVAPTLSDQDTASRILDSHVFGSGLALSLPALHIPSQKGVSEVGDIVRRILDRQAHDSLPYFLDQGEDSDRLLSYGKEGWRAVKAFTETICRESDGAKNCLIVGHPIALALIGYAGPRDLLREKIPQMRVSDECEGFQFVTEIGDTTFVREVIPLPQISLET